MAFDVSNFYLNTPMERFKYIKLRLCDIPSEVIKEYKLYETDKVTTDGFVYVKVCTGMYGLPQAGTLAQQLLKKCLNKRGYYQSKTVPGLWLHLVTLLCARRMWLEKDVAIVSPSCLSNVAKGV